MKHFRVLRSGWIPLVFCLGVTVCRPAGGQTYYKWTDEQGIVHFSDQVPADGKQRIEERRLVAPAPRDAEPGVTSAAADGSAQPGSAPEAADRSGPARVVLVEHQTPRSGPSSMHIIGKVKNVGGEAAQQVAVSISALDPSQGNPCLQAETTVSPSSLPPGETGNFESDVDSPCLFGDTNVDVVPTWQQ
jgi:hypothetical protein